MTRQALIAGFALCFCVACDGSPSGPSGGFVSGGGGGSTDRSMTARVDGAQWTASSISVTNQTGASPVLTISGTGSRAGDPSTRTTDISFTVINPSVGTFDLGLAGTQTGTLTLQVSDGVSPDIWLASPVNPGSGGRVTLTVFGGGRAAGTFAATVLATQGGATGSRSVTDGAFDVEF